jgi:hypothetical protein
MRYPQNAFNARSYESMLYKHVNHEPTQNHENRITSVLFSGLAIAWYLGYVIRSYLELNGYWSFPGQPWTRSDWSRSR